MRIRPYLNGDTPALADLWNRAMPVCAQISRPLSAHEFDLLVMGRTYFDRLGLIVAEDSDPKRLLGFVHAGFGPEQPEGPSHTLDRDCGTLAMLAIDPDLNEPEQVARPLIDAAERYLFDAGAQVLYAGGRFPVNPFYWGFYGGSEFAGILDGHARFHRALGASSVAYDAAYTAVLLSAPIERLKLFHPQMVRLRRQAEFHVEEDAIMTRWWDGQALSLFPLTRFTLVDRANGQRIAKAVTWEMNLYCREDPQLRAGLVNMEVSAAYRRRGFGRRLLIELAKYLRDRTTAQPVKLIELQTDAANHAAIGLYESLGFQRIGTTTLYRRQATDKTGIN